MQQIFKTTLYQGPRVLRRLEWFGTDKPKNYWTFFKGRQNLYAPGDFLYEFNERGFRCESFREPAELPIMFTGDSHIEGVGLPLEEVWTHKVMCKLRAETGLTIPYWSTAETGMGIDSIAYNLYINEEYLSAIPKHVFCLNGPLFLRELMWKEPFRRRSNAPKAPEQLPDGVRKIVEDEWFGKHQVLRSCMIIEKLLQVWGAKFYIGGFIPHELDFICDNFESFVRVDLPDPIKSDCDWARDAYHYGPRFHDIIADKFWAAYQCSNNTTSS